MSQVNRNDKSSIKFRSFGFDCRILGLTTLPKIDPKAKKSKCIRCKKSLAGHFVRKGSAADQNDFNSTKTAARDLQSSPSKPQQNNDKSSAVEVSNMEEVTSETTANTFETDLPTTTTVLRKESFVNIISNPLESSPQNKLKENEDGSKRTGNLSLQTNEFSFDQKIQTNVQSTSLTTRNDFEIEKEKTVGEKSSKQTIDSQATNVFPASTAKQSSKQTTDSNARTTSASTASTDEQSPKQTTDSQTTIKTVFTAPPNEEYEQSVLSAETYLTVTPNSSEFLENNFPTIENPSEHSTDSNTTTTTGFTTSTVDNSQQSALSAETCLAPNSNEFHENNFPMIILTEADLRTELMDVDEIVSSPPTATLTDDFRTEICQSQLADKVDTRLTTISSTIPTSAMNKSCIDASDDVVAEKCSFISSEFSTAMVDLDVRTTVKPSADLPISSTRIAILEPDTTSISLTLENETEQVSESFLSENSSKSILAATSNVDIRDKNFESQHMEDNNSASPTTANESQLVGTVALPTFETTKIDFNVKTPLEDTQKTFKCSYCCKLFKGKISLRNHTKHNHIDKKLECQKCKKLYTSSHRLKRHDLEVHQNVKDHECSICSKRYKAANGLNQHIQRAHLKAEKRFQCHICPLKSFYKADLQKHISSVHEKNRPFLCSKCPKTFAYEKELKIHFQMVHSNDKRTQTCKICGLAFFLGKEVNRHVRRVHDENPERPFRCNICFVSYKWERRLKVHNGTVHYKSKEDENNEKNLKEKESLSIKDPLLQFDLNSDNFDLPVNDEKEGSQRSKQKEMQTKTDREKFSKTKKKQKMSRKMDVKVVSCDVCQKTISCSRNLYRHKIQMHSESPKFECEKCEIKFPTKGLLTKHEKQIHIKDQFSCQDCDKIFLSKAAMTSHIKIIHLQILDYKCGECKRQFGFLPSFKRHLKIFGHKSE